MKPVLIYDNNFYPYNGQFIAQGGDNIYLDYEIDGTRFFLVKFRTIDQCLLILTLQQPSIHLYQRFLSLLNSLSA